MIFGTVGTGGEKPLSFNRTSTLCCYPVCRLWIFECRCNNDGTTLSGKFFANDGTIKDQFTIIKSVNISENTK